MKRIKQQTVLTEVW